ncbi:conserved hypothetical protein [Ahrensia sp. R2A130]|nr:conserved hypothetical protein [Ahrensia sp. R2A130]
MIPFRYGNFATCKDERHHHGRDGIKAVLPYADHFYAHELITQDAMNLLLYRNMKPL